MSSAVAHAHDVAPTTTRSGLDRALSHGHRVDSLAERIGMHIESLVPRGRARCLDIGCGDMAIAEAIHEHSARTDWRCIDVYPVPPDLRRDARWSKYRQFDGRTIPFNDDEFDVALLCDVLHQTPENAARLLAEAGRVATNVLVKDRHFTREGFVRLAGEQDLVITALDCGMEPYEHPPVVRKALRPDWHFVAVLRHH